MELRGKGGAKQAQSHAGRGNPVPPTTAMQGPTWASARLGGRLDGSPVSSKVKAEGVLTAAGSRDPDPGSGWWSWYCFFGCRADADQVNPASPVAKLDLGDQQEHWEMLQKGQKLTFESKPSCC